MDQKKLTVLTLFVVVAGAVSINEFVIRKSEKDQSRQVASASERFEPEQIKWEQELARTLAHDTKAKTVIGEKPDLNDRFLYGALEGRYQAQVVNGKLLKISLIPNQTALELNMNKLIDQYSSLFKGAKSFEKVQTQGHFENLALKSSDGRRIGQVLVERNDQGRILNIEIQ